MRWSIYCVLFLVTACASQPRSDEQAAFTNYWDCAFSAARPYIPDDQLSPREAAMRAQAECYDFYARYQTAHGDYSRSVVTPDNYDMATRLADHAALQKKRAVTSRLVEWIAQARQ